MDEEPTIDDYEDIKRQKEILVPFDEIAATIHNELIFCEAPLKLFYTKFNERTSSVRPTYSLRLWFQENIDNTTYYVNYCEEWDEIVGMYFKTEEDAVAFKLRWDE